MTVNQQFIIAVRNNDIEKIESLISSGADVDYCDSQFGSPLITCITRQNIDVLAVLLKYGANVNKVNHFNVAPIEMALKVANASIINLLVNNGACLKKTSSNFYLKQIARYVNPFSEPKQSY